MYKDLTSTHMKGTYTVYIGPGTKFRLLLPLLPLHKYSNERYIIWKRWRSWRLLTVLDLRQCCVRHFPKDDISLLVKVPCVLKWLYRPKFWVNFSPCVKMLSCYTYQRRKYDFKSFICLEILKVSAMKSKSLPKIKNKSLFHKKTYIERMSSSMAVLHVRSSIFT